MFFIISSALSDYTVLLHGGQQTSEKDRVQTGLQSTKSQQTTTNPVFLLLVTHGDEDGPSAVDKRTTELQNRVEHELRPA